ncbi:hypothetical protein [Candidatus Lokiarchaeum ossiferum]
MSSPESIFLIVSIIFLILQIITATFLIYNGIRNKMGNVVVLGLAVFLSFSSSILVFGLKLTWVQVVIPLMFAFILMVPFTQMTFHRNTKINYHKIYAIILFLFVGKVVFANLEYKNSFVILFFSLLFESLLMFICFYWTGKSSMDAYNAIKIDPLEHWIKIRLKYMGIICKIYAFAGFPQFLILIDQSHFIVGQESPISVISFVIVLVFNAIFLIGMILIWVMPKKFKNYLNRKSPLKSQSDEELSEEEIEHQFMERK